MIVNVTAFESGLTLPLGSTARTLKVYEPAFAGVDRDRLVVVATTAPSRNTWYDTLPLSSVLPSQRS